MRTFQWKVSVVSCFFSGLTTFSPVNISNLWSSIKVPFANLHNLLAVKRIIYPLHVITLETHKARRRRNICRSSHFCMTNLRKKSFQRASMRVFANRHETKTNSLLIETSKDRSFFVSRCSSRWINVRRSFLVPSPVWFITQTIFNKPSLWEPLNHVW